MTPRAAQCLDFIRGYIETNGYSPSYEEIMIGIGFSSKSEVHRQVKSLLAENRIGQIEGASRGVFLVDDHISIVMKLLNEALEHRHLLSVKQKVLESLRILNKLP